jgi:hypothetical protein
MLDAGTLTQAFTLLTGRPGARGCDPLAPLASHITPGTVPVAVPESWRGATPPLRTRIARTRDQWLPPATRLRHATMLGAPRPPAPLPAGYPDPAVIRAARLPDQIWPDWAVRLTDGPAARPGKFRSSALIALLLPHSQMPLAQITALVSGQPKRHVAGYQMGKLPGPAALRILTELAFALDDHDIPVNYQRRRDLAAGTTLIDDTTWTTIAGDAGIHGSRPGHARCYLYELLTGCSLRTAPPPYRLATSRHAGYSEFVITMPAGLASALAGQARRLLSTWGIDDEPVEWQPPADWVTVTTWPGADPAGTDPAPIHRALLHEHTPPGQIAADLGISADHLSQVLRRHPLRPIRRTLVPQAAPASAPPGQQPGVLYLDPAWLREEYLTWHRSLNDIAAQIGCPVQTLNTFARAHGIRIRSRGTKVFTAPVATPGCHPSDLPEPLRHVLTGRQRAAAARPPSHDRRTRQHQRGRPAARGVAKQPLHAGRPARTRLRRTPHPAQSPPSGGRSPHPARPAATPASPRLLRADNSRPGHLTPP